jgi:UDP-GlcNAc:undecaprenyl-phosphate/decaprenyl-phosphate GlcNAc-1-phosphate transferase
MIFENFIGPARPMSWAFQFWPVLAGSFVSALAATWLCKRIAIKFGIVDKPDNLVKTHKEPVAYLGGVGILLGLMVGMLTGIYCIADDVYFSDALRMMLGILAGAAIACFVGVVDDIFNLSPGRKILGQVAAAGSLLAVGILPSLDFLCYFGITMPDVIDVAAGGIIVVVFVLGATNSLNLLDGLDGLCAGVTTIITIAMLFLAVHLATWASGGFANPGDPVRIILCLALVGGVCGFLPFNRHPAKIFMGDAGSMLLGFSIAALLIMFGRTTPRWLLASIVVFGLPILDTAVALARRLISKRPLFVSDRGHIYDQMIDRGIPLKKTVALCYLLTAIYALIGLAMSQIRTRYAAIIYLLVFIISAVVVWKKGYLKMEGLRGAIRKGPKE